MHRKQIKLFILTTLVLTSYFYICSSVLAEPLALERINKEDRILILAPHPDDEAIGCAGIIQEALNKKAKVKIIYLTNGDHNQLAFIIYEKRLVFRKGEFIHMGEVRRREAIGAISSLGLSLEDITFLGYPDFGTFTMFTRYWKSPKPFKSLLTRVNKVPYPENFSFGSSYLPENILSDLKGIIEEYKPNKIFVSHPADTNGDHRALSLFLNVALWDLEGKIPSAKVYHYLVHHIGWPRPARYHPELNITVPEDLTTSGNWFYLKLNPHMVSEKYNALRCYKSQTESSAFYLFSFARTNELFQEPAPLRLKSQETQNPDIFCEYTVKENELHLVLKHHKNDHDITRVAIYLFGWRKDIPFSDMPKIFLDIRSNGIAVFDGKKRIKLDSLSQEFNGQNARVKVPLALLGNPQKALISARIYSKEIPYVQSIWRRTEFE